MLSSADCRRLTAVVKEKFLKAVTSYKTTIFLCGADITLKDRMRFKVAEALERHYYSHWIDIVYPEAIFEELLYSSKTSDLLSLENLLAESVDVIILIPESPGSFAELGAFANDEKLRSKIICVLDKKYKKHKSFINQGPVKLIKKVNNSGVIYVNPDDIRSELDKLINSIKKIKKSSTKRADKISLLHLDNFLLASIYLLEPVLKDTLQAMVACAMDDDTNAFQATTTALTILTKKRQIELTPEGFKVTALGVSDFFALRKATRLKSPGETFALDDIRLEVLNLRLRNKKLKV